MKHKLVRKKHPTERRDRTPIIFDDSRKAAKYIGEYINHKDVEDLERLLLEAQAKSQSPNPRVRIGSYELHNKGARIQIEFIKEDDDVQNLTT